LDLEYLLDDGVDKMVVLLAAKSSMSGGRSGIRDPKSIVFAFLGTKCLATTCSCVIISPMYQHIWLILGQSLFVKNFKACEAKSRYTGARRTQPG
jgi:hypothetical protein